MGSVIAQACHASTAVLFENIDCDPTVLEYFADAAKMHKVIGECAGEEELLLLAENLRAKGIVHKVWMEQPENMPTAIALKPYPQSQVAHLLSKYKLFE